MKNTLSIVTVLLLCACSQPGDSPTVDRNGNPPDSTLLMAYELLGENKLRAFMTFFDAEFHDEVTQHGQTFEQWAATHTNDWASPYGFSVHTVEFDRTTSIVEVRPADKQPLTYQLQLVEGIWQVVGWREGRKI